MTAPECKIRVVLWVVLLNVEVDQYVETNDPTASVCLCLHMCYGSCPRCRL